MTIILETFVYVALCIAIGLGFFWMFGKVVSSNGRGNKYQQLQAEISNRQIARRDEKQKLLYMIGGPECPDGTFSPRQNHLWGKFNELNRIDKALTNQERNELVEARGYLPDEIADIIEGIEND
jgi:hypothetical protein